MRSGALLALIAPHSLSNIELLVPLMMSDTSEESDTSAASELYERARVDKDMPFSNIPSSAFVLDESPPAALQKHKRGHKHSRKQDFTYQPRSIYLDSIQSAESGERDERSEQVELGVCSRLLRSPAGRHNELLLLLCSELQDAAPAPPASHAPPAPRSRCQQSGAPLWAESPIRGRRDFMPIGENSYCQAFVGVVVGSGGRSGPHCHTTGRVQSYMRSPRKRPHHMPNWGQE